MGVKALRDLVTPTGADAYVPGHGDTSFDVLEYALELDYDVDGNRLRGKAVITAEAVQDLESFELDLRGLKVDKVTVRSYGAAKHSHHRGRLRVRLRRPVPEGSTFVCTVVYGGHPTPVGSRWGTLGWEELTDGAIVASQPAGAPSWFPCNDRPSDKAGYTLAITVPSDYTVVANGAPSRPRRRASSTTWAFDQREPMATYLATVQVGRYESWTTSAGDVTLRHVVPARLRQRYGHDFGRQAEMVAVFQERFGAYPFAAGYTVVVTDDELEIPLEAQGLSVFGANHLDGERRHERLVAHELAHQWFGNALTLTTWDQIWLHEGFACYAEWLWSEASGGRPAAELATHWHGRLSELDQDVVLADPGPEAMFDDRVYKRGALLLHALRRRVGDDAFFDLVRSWVARHRHANVTTDGFREHASSATGEDLDDLFDAWLLATALPPLP